MPVAKDSEWAPSGRESSATTLRRHSRSSGCARRAASIGAPPASARAASGVLRPAGGEPREGLVPRRRAQRDGLATAADGGQEPRGPVAHQDDHRGRRRLLERLEERVGRRGLQGLGGVDHDDAMARAVRGQRHEVADPRAPGRS